MTYFKYSCEPKKLTQLTVCFKMTGLNPSKSDLSVESLKKLSKCEYVGEVIIHTFILSKGQMITDSIKAVDTPVATPALLWELLEPLNKS